MPVDTASATDRLMRLLAARRARVNAVGLVGLVENMPSGNAQRPGDIVRSMSGQISFHTSAPGRPRADGCFLPSTAR